MVLFAMKTTAEDSKIRITPRSKAVLQSLAKQQGKPMQAVLDEAIDHYRRDKFLDDVNAAYARLRSDPKGWKEERAERALWDKTLADGSSSRHRSRYALSSQEGKRINANAQHPPERTLGVPTCATGEHGLP
jgi:predicted DNA-binding protein